VVVKLPRPVAGECRTWHSFSGDERGGRSGSHSPTLGFGNEVVSGDVEDVGLVGDDKRHAGSTAMPSDFAADSRRGTDRAIAERWLWRAYTFQKE